VDRAADKALELEHRVQDRRNQRHSVTSDHISRDQIVASEARITSAVEAFLRGIALSHLILGQVHCLHQQ
jgi:hypothetical protein